MALLDVTGDAEAMARAAEIKRHSPALKQ